MNYIQKFKMTLEVIEAVIYSAHTNTTHLQMRCHEVARVTCNVLQNIGYDSMRVVDGVFIDETENVVMTHSWIEGSLNHGLDNILIEAKPYDKTICPNSDNVRRGELMLVPTWDNRFSKYHRLTASEFSKRLSDEGTVIDYELIDRCSNFSINLLTKDEIEQKVKIIIEKFGLPPT